MKLKNYSLKFPTLFPEAGKFLNWAEKPFKQYEMNQSLNAYKYKSANS